MLSEEGLRNLADGRWTVPVLAEIGRHDGARFADLLLALGLARESLSRTLDHLTACGWAARNPGHGHPLRPEYVLTPAGRPAAAACQRMMLARRSLGLDPAQLPRWSLPILHRLHPSGAHFGGLRAGLAPVTPRALSLNLKQMIDVRLVARDVTAGYPPSTRYSLAEPGKILFASLSA